MKYIPLTQGKYALVDDEDFEWLSQWRWFAYWHRRTFYAQRNRHKADGLGPGIIQMHRVILRPPEGLETDHVNGEGLDNRRENLRAVTPSANKANRIHQKHGRDLPMGVHHKGRGFRALIQINGHLFDLGTFATPEEASDVYRAARRERIEEGKSPTIIQRGPRLGRVRNLPRGIDPYGRGFMARIQVDGRRYYLGTYATPEEASKVYQAARAKRFAADAVARERQEGEG